MRTSGYREIFIFIAGSTPQVVTETIYALAVQDPPVYADELLIITTATGKAIMEDALVNKGKLKELAAEYGIPALSLDDRSFAIPVGGDSMPLDDIRDYAENELMGDLITTVIRERALDNSVRLHCSLAGGRKTMAFYLGAALQLFGRSWDKLYHVLVTPEFESNAAFYYKPKQPVTITGNGKVLNTQDASITLAQLPFIRLREKVALDETHFRSLVAEGQKEIDMATMLPEVRVNLSERLVYIGQVAVQLQPLHLMIYVAYLKYKLRRCKFPEREYCRDCTDCFPTLLELATKPALEEMAKDYLIIAPTRASDLLHKYREGLSLDCIRQSISKIKRTISAQLENDAHVQLYAITTATRSYANSRHGIRAEKSKIRIEK